MNTRILKFVFVLLLISLISESEAFSQEDPDFFFYPTPSELFDVIDKEKLSYNKDLTNPVDNEQNYIVSTSKYLNLGVSC